jgi:hypothetical protein
MDRGLTCAACGAVKETRHMQLRTAQGFRDLTCTGCGWRGRCAKMLCTCSKIWHHCETHRVDPAEHRSLKACKATTADAQQAAPLLDSRRAAPATSNPRKSKTLHATVTRRVDAKLYNHGGASTQQRRPNLPSSSCPVLANRFPVFANQYPSALTVQVEAASPSVIGEPAVALNSASPRINIELNSNSPSFFKKPRLVAPQRASAGYTESRSSEGASVSRLCKRK